jgi:hypothetical protein
LGHHSDGERLSAIESVLDLPSEHRISAMTAAALA